MKCWAILPEDRREIFREVFPDGKVLLKHPLLVQWRGILVYEGDPSVLTREQKEKLAEIVSSIFNIPKESILRDLDMGIMPVKAEGVLVVCDNPFMFI